MNPSDITRLRELAGKMPVGPYFVEETSQNFHVQTSAQHKEYPTVRVTLLALRACRLNPKAHIEQRDRADYVAACDPQTIISLCDRIKVLEDALKELADVRDGDDPLGWVEATARAALDGTP